MPLAVSLKKVRKRFGDVTAVDDVTLSIDHGERVAIIGPNGAGKTTTLLMMLGAVESDVGTVSVLGHMLPKHRSKAMEGVGFAAGYLPLPSKLKVGEALQMFADLSGVEDSQRRVDDILDDLQVPYLKDQRCASLSSGQATLVGIAKAVLHEPALLVLDEPTASLDPDVAFRVRAQLEKLTSETDATLVITSHYMSEVEQLADRVILLSGGRVNQDGPSDQLAALTGHEDLESLFMAVAAEQRGVRL